MKNTVGSTNFFAYDACEKCGHLNRTDATKCGRCDTSLVAVRPAVSPVRHFSPVARAAVVTAVTASAVGMSWWFLAH